MEVTLLHLGKNLSNIRRKAYLRHVLDFRRPDTLVCELTDKKHLSNLAFLLLAFKRKLEVVSIINIIQKGLVALVEERKG